MFSEDVQAWTLTILKKQLPRISSHIFSPNELGVQIDLAGGYSQLNLRFQISAWFCPGDPGTH